MSNYKKPKNSILVFLFISLFSFTTSKAQLIYNPSNDCFLLLTAKGNSSCNIYVEQYSFGSPSDKKYKYAELTFNNDYLDTYKKYSEDFNSSNKYDHLEFLLKLEFENDGISQLKSYNNDGDLIKKFRFQYDSKGKDNTVSVIEQNSGNVLNKSVNIDSKGILCLPYLHFLRDITDDQRIVVNEGQQNNANVTSISKFEDESYDQTKQLFVFSNTFNLLTYKRYNVIEEETMSGFKKTEMVEQKFRLKYSTDTYGNPMEIVVYGDMDEPEYKFTFEYF